MVDTRLCSFHSLSSGEEESDTEEPAKKTVAEGKEAEAEDEEEEMEKKVAELKAEEVAELKRYVHLRSCVNLVCVNNKKN